jgi:DNA-binding MarR family transcriptional regulator
MPNTPTPTTKETLPSTRRSRKTEPEPTLDDIGLVDMGLVGDSLGYCIKRTQVRTYAMLYDMVLSGEMTPARMTALSLVSCNPGINQSALGAQLGITGPSVVKVVDALERLDLIDRRLTENDRRSRSLFLTKHGKAELDRIQENVEKYEAAIATRLSKSERRQLISLLDKVAQP